MTTRKKTILGIAALLTAGLIAAPILWAHGGGSARCLFAERSGFFGHGDGRHFGEMARVIHELDLTKEQREALHRIHEVTREQNAQAREELHNGLMDAAKVLLADPDDIAGARAVLASRQASIESLKENAMNGISQGLAVLTPGQRAVLVEHLEKHALEIDR